MRRIGFAAAAAWMVAGGAAAQPLTRADLQAALEARDRTIADLQARIAVLERERAAPPPTPIPGATGAATAAAKPTTSDEAELEALSRTLVQRGALVLPPGRMEFVPTFAYALSELQGLALTPTPEGIPTVNDQRLRDDQLRATAALRFGLPWASQLEVQVPYDYLRQSRAVGDGTHATHSQSGLGDVQLSLSHQFVQERGWRPNLVGAVSWRFPTGTDPFRANVAAIATGAGPAELGARVTAVKSSDPLVFFGTLSYAHDMSVQEPVGAVQLGDAYGLELGTVLSVNPQTSLTFGLTQTFRQRTRIDGTGAPGTDSTASALQLGFDRVLTPRLLLDISLGVGLTRDAPDYAFQVSLPFRFR